jgi:uracil DNA glycosylase
VSGNEYITLSTLRPDGHNAYRMMGKPTYVQLDNDQHIPTSDLILDHPQGLAFSVRKGVRIPPSLRNMYKELGNEISEFKIPQHGSVCTKEDV